MNKPTIISYDSFAELNEKKKEKDNTYGCAMLDFSFPDIKEFHKSIDKEDLYTGEKDDKRGYGLEKESHVTLLYGLHTEDIEDKQVKDICLAHEYEPLTLYHLSAFENEKFDVLKFDVKGKSLHKVNKALCELPFTTDHPKYHPHVTVAYLLPGKAKKYTKQFKDAEYEVIPTSIVYSKPDGTKKHWKVEVKTED